jgi:hypothetical protein
MLRPVLAVATLIFGSWTGAADAQKISRPGVYQGYSHEQFSSWVKESRYVAVRDGTRLAVDIYRPAVDGQTATGRFPVIWVHTPYRRAYIDADGSVRNAVEQMGLLDILKHGYVIAAVDTRGRGASFGVRRGFQDRTEALDAYDMTEWFAAQPWSDGNIGMAGCSYVGGSVFHAATTAPPHLKAIAPGCTDFDKYGMVSRGGITAQFNTRPENPGQDFGQGVLPVAEDVDGKQAQAAIDEHVKGTPMAELWRGMPYRDDVSPLLGVAFWREASVSSYIETIERSGVGIFIWGNWLDEGSFESVLAFNNLRNPRKLWMGEWGHCQVGDFPMGTELLRFFDHFLKKVDNGWDREPPVYYRTVNAPPNETWRSAAQWPLSNTQSRVLHLTRAATPSAPGRLDTSAIGKHAGTDRFTVNYDPKCNGRADTNFMMWPCGIESHGLAYETDALSGDLHIAGHPLVEVWLSTSTNDADLFVYLEHIDASGAEHIISHGRLRASLRSEQSPPYRTHLGLPYHRGNRSDAQPMTPGEAALLRIDLLPTSTLIKAGDRLRLRFAGADPRQRSRTLQYSPPPVLGIHRDQKRPSRLHLPVFHGSP